MLRSACLLILLELGFHASINAQDGPVNPPKRIQNSDTSPLAKLSGRTSSVTPAAFLQSNEKTNPSRPLSDSKNEIPSILTGKQRSTARPISKKPPQSSKIEIDPLNIPSSPIKQRTANIPPLNSGFQPKTNNSQSSSFQLPNSSFSKPPSAKSTPTSAKTFQPSPKKSGQTASKSTTATRPKTGVVIELTPSDSKPRAVEPNQRAVRLNGVTGTEVEEGSAPMQASLEKNIDEDGPRIEPRPSSLVPRNGQMPRTTSQSRGSAIGSNKKLEATPIPRLSAPVPQGTTGKTITRVAERSPRIPRGTPNTVPDSNSIISAKSPVAKTDVPDSFSSQQLSPQIKVVSSGPRSISVNKSAPFQVKITNVGQIDASEVMVGIEVPQWVEVTSRPVPTGGEATTKDLGSGKGIVWSLSYLPAGRDATISIQLEPKENRPFQLKTEWTSAPVSSEARVMVTQAKLATRISGPTEVKYGAKAVYTITIENTGNGDAEKVSVALSDSLGGDRADVGLIKAGATKNFEVELTAGKAGPLKLEASVAGDAGINSAIAKEIVVRRANLVVQANGPQFKYAGSALTYKISVENQGDAAAKNINAAALLPLNAEYISGLDQTSGTEGRKISWKIPEIPAGSKREFIITCLINQAGEARMEVGIRAEDGLTSGGIVKTKIEALADLKLEVVDPRGPQAVGRQVTYELHIKNRGTKSARNVSISGEFSDFIDPIAGTGAKATIDKGGVILFAPIPEIKVGESVVVKVTAEASQAGTHTFRAIVECEEQDIRKVSEGTTKFFGDSK